MITDNQILECDTYKLIKMNDISDENNHYYSMIFHNEKAREHLGHIVVKLDEIKNDEKVSLIETIGFYDFEENKFIGVVSSSKDKNYCNIPGSEVYLIKE